MGVVEKKINHADVETMVNTINPARDRAHSGADTKVCVKERVRIIVNHLEKSQILEKDIAYTAGEA